jgi:hypothetical protein
MREIPIHTGKKSLGEAMAAVFNFSELKKLEDNQKSERELFDSTPVGKIEKGISDSERAISNFDLIENLKRENYPSHEQASGRSNREDLHKPGAKDDAEKVDLSIILECFPRALFAVGEVADYGARKYSRGGCLSVPDGQTRYEAAGMRHALKRHKGEECDDESGMLHLAHEAWNAIAKLELYLRSKENVTTSSTKIP